LTVGVIVISLGERPWLPIVEHWLGRYCRRWNHDLVVLREPLLTDVRSDQFDRFQNYGRAQKLGVGRFFGKYDRIIQMDDTCIVSPATPDLVQTVPEEAIGCWIEGLQRGPSFDAYLKEHAVIYERVAPLARERFYNSGVVVYSRQHAALFDESTIPWGKIKADRAFPTQGYLSHRSEVYQYGLFDLGPAYNRIGSEIARSGDIRKILDSTYVFHLTSAVARNRMWYAAEIDRLLRERLGD
jgi:hypothetical protein